MLGILIRLAKYEEASSGSTRRRRSHGHTFQGTRLAFYNLKKKQVGLDFRLMQEIRNHFKTAEHVEAATRGKY